MYKNDKIIRRYCESFKLKILAKLSTENTQRVSFANSTLFHLQRLMRG